MTKTTTFIEVYIDETSATKVITFTCDEQGTGKKLDRAFKHLQRWMSLKDGRAIAALYQTDKPLVEAKKWFKWLTKGK